jgi:hypothetical protein
LTGSFLVTETIRDCGAASHKSEAATEIPTSTILWFGGHSALGVAITELITGGVVSCTVTVKEPVAVLS